MYRHKQVIGQAVWYQWQNRSAAKKDMLLLTCMYSVPSCAAERRNESSKEVAKAVILPVWQSCTWPSQKGAASPPAEMQHLSLLSCQICQSGSCKGEVAQIEFRAMCLHPVHAVSQTLVEEVCLSATYFFDTRTFSRLLVYQ